MLLVSVKHAKKHLHLANFVRKVYMNLLNFCELANLPTNQKKLSNGHTGSVSAINLSARQGLWLEMISVEQHFMLQTGGKLFYTFIQIFGHRIKNQHQKSRKYVVCLPGKVRKFKLPH